MQTGSFSRVTVFATSMLLGACAGGASDEPVTEEVVEEIPTESFVVTLIDRADPAPELGTMQAQQAMQGHFANMKRLAGEGKLLVAGPFGRGHVPPEPNLSGLFLWSTDKVSDAIQWAAGDPAAIAGLFRFRHFVVEMPSAVRRVPELDLELLESLPEEQRQNPGATIRPYVLAVGRSGETKVPEDLDESVVVLRSKRADGAPMLLLAMDSVDEAVESFGDGFLLRSWAATKVLRDLD